MATVVHIPLSELPDAQSLRERIRDAEEIVLETADGPYRFTREREGPGRTAEEMLRSLSSRANAVDDEWSDDLRKIIHENRTNDRDPWAE